MKVSLVKARAGGIKTSWKPKALAMLFDCLNSVRSMLLAKGHLHSVPQKVFRRRYKPKKMS